MPRREIRRGLAALLLGLVVIAAGGCGGDEDKRDVTALLDRAFKQSIKSADLKVDAELQIDGLQGLDRPVRVQASGPFIGGDGKLPQVDVDLTIGAAEAGQTVQSGFLSTGDRAFVKFGGEFYEQPQADVARANRELAKGRGRGRGSLADLGLRPRAWIADAKAEDDEKVAGVETEHVSATLDARRVFADLNKLVSRSANAVGGATPGVPEPLTAAQLDELAAIVKSPTFDVYVSKQDGTIRRVSGNIRVVVPEKDRSRLNGISGGSLRFTVELRKVNGGQAVEVPAKVRPIADLSQQLGGARALTPQTQPAPETPAPGAPAAPGSSGDTPDLGTFEQYSQCLDRARPDDTRALSRCAELLR